MVRRVVVDFGRVFNSRDVAAVVLRPVFEGLVDIDVFDRDRDMFGFETLSLDALVRLVVVDVVPPSPVLRARADGRVDVEPREMCPWDPTVGLEGGEARSDEVRSRLWSGVFGTVGAVDCVLFTWRAPLLLLIFAVDAAASAAEVVDGLVFALPIIDRVPSALGIGIDIGLEPVLAVFACRETTLGPGVAGFGFVLGDVAVGGRVALLASEGAFATPREDMED